MTMFGKNSLSIKAVLTRKTALLVPGAAGAAELSGAGDAK
jgi:hypothetical protein